MNSIISTNILAILMLIGYSVGQGNSLIFNSLPSQQGWIYESGNSSSMEPQIYAATGTSLAMNSIGRGYSGFAYRKYLTIDPNKKYVLTAKLKIAEYELQSPGNPYGFALVFQLGNETFEMAISPLGIMAAEGAAHTNKWLSKTIDVSQFHEYRLEAQVGGTSKAFVDNIPIGTANPGLVASITSNYVYFGDATAGANARVEILSLTYSEKDDEVANAQFDTLFEDAFLPQQAGWTFQSPSSGFLGEINNNTNVSSVTLTINSTSSKIGTVEFDLLTFRSMDDSTSCCTDVLTFIINGQPAFAGAFGDRGTDSFISNTAGATMSVAAGIPDGNSRRISVPIGLLNGTNSITWSYSHLQPLFDEAWGLDNVVVFSEKGNATPVANAGENVTIASVSKNSTVLMGMATDPDAGDVLQCRWLNGSEILSDWSAVKPDSSCPLELSGFTFGIGQANLVLEVNDGKETAMDEMILTIENSAPTVVLSGSGSYEVGSNVSLGGTVSDFDGDLLHYSWTISGNIQCEGNIQTLSGGSPVLLPTCDVSGLGLGSHEAMLQVSDGINAPLSGRTEIQMTDNSNPTLSPVASPGILWPPNHQMVSVIISANAADNSGSVTLAASVSSNEQQDGLGDGDEPQDWTQPVIDPSSGNIMLTLRSERSGKGTGRIYSITVSATDLSGNKSITTLEVKVPHSQSKK